MVSTQQEMPPVLPAGRRFAPAVIAAMVLLGALVLWFHYGTTVFFEMISSGISACF